ncbi:30S ribosomal protein S19 [Nymphaea thermarum]|nr:30S ribosomal protein S19 [Nymphaea thermarum]
MEFSSRNYSWRCSNPFCSDIDRSWLDMVYTKLVLERVNISINETASTNEKMKRRGSNHLWPIHLKKKKPFVADHLLSKIELVNKADERTIIVTYSRAFNIIFATV